MTYVTPRTGLSRNKKTAIAVAIGVVSLCCGLTGVAALVADPDTAEQGREPPMTITAAAPTSAAAAPAVDTPTAPDATATPGALPDNGIPPAPNAQVKAAYLADLNAIDPRIVGDKDPDRIVGRGRDQCGSIARYPNDRAKLVELTNTRFTAPTHPNGFGLATAERVLDVVHQRLCPTYPMSTA